MANVHELPVQPDEAGMANALNAVFAATLNGMVEICWIGSSDTIGARNFDLTELDEAAAYAAHANKIVGRNLYFGANPRRLDIPDHARGSDSDVIAISALKIDGDEPGCLAAAADLACDIGIPATLAFATGRTPSLRGSLWWVLEEPDSNIERAVAIEKRLIAIFRADRVTFNPARIMRLPGSVAWPSKPGRIVEMTGAYDNAVTRKAPYTLDEIEHALNRHGGATPSLSRTIHALDLSDAKKTINVPELLAAARDPGKFHENALPAIMSLISRGAQPATLIEILTGAIAMSGVNTNQRTGEMVNMVRGAVRKCALAPQFEQPSKDDLQSPFVSIDDMLKREPPAYLVDGYLTEGGLSVLWGASGAFKSFIAIDLAMSVAAGVAWHGQRTEQRPVIYICAEGQYGFGVRALAWRQHRSADIKNFHVLPVPVNFLEPTVIGTLIDAIRAHIPDAAQAPFIPVDTLARNFGSGNENETRDMNQFIASAGRLQADLNAHVMLIHHTGKDDTKGERGAYALRGAVDTSIKLVRDGKSERITLEHWKQKEGPERPPMPLRMVRVEAVHPVTGECVDSLIPVLDEPQEQRGQTVKLSKLQRDLLAQIDAGNHALGALAAVIGADKSNVRRALNTLRDHKILSVDDAGFWHRANTKEQ